MLTLIMLTTIVRPIYQAASFSFSLIHHEGCDCRYTEILEEFQNLSWLNCNGWNYIIAVTSKWFSLVTD